MKCLLIYLKLQIQRRIESNDFLINIPQYYNKRHRRNVLYQTQDDLLFAILKKYFYLNDLNYNVEKMFHLSSKKKIIK